MRQVVLTNRSSWITRLAHAAVLLFCVALAAACGDEEEHSCDNGAHRCARPEMPFCDLEGVFPESMGISGVCIPDPYLDAGVDATP